MMTHRPGAALPLIDGSACVQRGQFFVAKDRAALGRVEKLTLPMNTGTLTAASDGAGGLMFKDGKATAYRITDLPETGPATIATGTAQPPA